MPQATNLFTVPQLARVFGVTERRVDYAIRSYDIAPSTRVGNIRAYDADAAERVRSAVLRIAGNAAAREVAHAH